MSLAQRKRKAADTEAGRKVVVVSAAASRAERAARGWAGPQAPKLLTAEQSEGSPQPPAAEVPLPDAARQMKSGASKKIPMKMDGERQAAL